MDLKLLREATRPEHEATEAAVPLVGPGLTRAGYVTVLQQFHTLVCAWDTVAAQEAPAVYAELVGQRRRCSSLNEDLLFFGVEGSGDVSAAVLQAMRELIHRGGPDSPEADYRFLGAMYVLEGSTLGGQYIAHHVEKELQLRPGEGDRFFRGYGKQTMERWREFQQVLAAVPDDQSGTVIAAAKEMFGIFRTWMSRGVTAIAATDVAANERSIAANERSHGSGTEAT